ncbi:hypothetical protein [Lutimaribacter saemankumensis]|uniref:Uncharacterized protein n=1 Tax=Lutimaribacter saemankumensis TaxID=490829 RepID=A0A1G8SBB9_9RHOB|nr:hypothetical protein [Lutimaribacter saemankumensis]SDJ26483.1 hypothetical protein SAMN05421850_11114 [Lutimaribacter saemankumensis]
MHNQLNAHRRMLFQAYRRFLAADRAWQTAQSAALTWLPAGVTEKTALIGNPGSRMRQLYQKRNRALARLELTRAEFKKAQLRLSRRSVMVVRLIAAG